MRRGTLDAPACAARSPEGELPRHRRDEPSGPHRAGGRFLPARGYDVGMDHDRWMRKAIDQARAGIAAGQSPFGAVVVRDGVIVAAGHNEVWMRTDVTAHAEVVAIQRACAVLRSIDLAGCTIYTTTEPCPMCASAIHWARIDLCVCGAAIADAAAAGFNELHVAASRLYREGGSKVVLLDGVQRDECVGLFEAWQRAGGRGY